MVGAVVGGLELQHLGPLLHSVGLPRRALDIWTLCTLILIRVRHFHNLKIYHTVNRLLSFLSSSHLGHLGHFGHFGHLVHSGFLSSIIQYYYILTDNIRGYRCGLFKVL